MRLLLVEDNRALADWLGRTLRKQHYTVDWVDNGADADFVLRSETFDLVILDGEAAKVGGMGICRQMKHELYNCPPVLLLVGRPGDAWLATWSEADAAVSHPLDPFVVREAVGEFFAAATAH